MSAIKLVCRSCKRSMDYDRSIDSSIPAVVTKIVQGHCDRCWHGDHDTETWYDAKGLEVPQNVGEP